jgi:hypothetical protein
MAAVALVEPFGLLADRAGLGLAALQPLQEHAHRIRQRLARCCRAVHLVATLGRAEMGEAGSGEDQVRAVRMVDGREETPRGKLLGRIDGAVRAGRLADLGQADALRDRRGREAAYVGKAGYERRTIFPRRYHASDAVPRAMLKQPEHPTSPILRACLQLVGHIRKGFVRPGLVCQAHILARKHGW